MEIIVETFIHMILHGCVDEVHVVLAQISFYIFNRNALVTLDEIPVGCVARGLRAHDVRQIECVVGIDAQNASREIDKIH